MRLPDFVGRQHVTRLIQRRVGPALGGPGAAGLPAAFPFPEDRLGQLDLTPQGYHLVVARFEPENHVHLIVDGFVRSGSRISRR